MFLNVALAKIRKLNYSLHGEGLVTSVSVSPGPGATGWLRMEAEGGPGSPVFPPGTHSPHAKYLCQQQMLRHPLGGPLALLTSTLEVAAKQL